MANKLTQEQLNKNYGQFIHEGLLLSTIDDIEHQIAAGGGTGGGTTGKFARTVNGKAPNASGDVTIGGADIIADSQDPTVTVTTVLRTLASDVSGKATSVNGKTATAGAITIGTDDIPADPNNPQGDKLNVAIKTLTQGLAGKVDNNTLNGYVKTTDLTTDLVPYAKTADLGVYAKKADLDAAFAAYIATPAFETEFKKTQLYKDLTTKP